MRPLLIAFCGLAATALLIGATSTGNEALSVALAAVSVALGTTGGAVWMHDRRATERDAS